MPNVMSDQGLQCLLTEISMENAVKMRKSSENPKTSNGLLQMIRMNEYPGQKRVKTEFECKGYIFCLISQIKR